MHSLYTYAVNNPLLYTDPTGNGPYMPKYNAWMEPIDPRPLPERYEGFGKPGGYVPGWWYDVINLGSNISDTHVNINGKLRARSDPSVASGLNYLCDAVYHASGGTGNIYYDEYGNRYRWEYVNTGYYENNAYGAGIFIHHGVQSNMFQVYLSSASTSQYPLITLYGSKLWGLGAEGRIELFGERVIMGVHLYTNEARTSLSGKKLDSKTTSFSGINASIGSIGFQLRYNWTEKRWYNSATSFIGWHSDRPLTISGINFTLYGGGGVSFGFEMDAKQSLLELTEYSIWYNELSSKWPTISFH